MPTLTATNAAANGKVVLAGHAAAGLKLVTSLYYSVPGTIDGTISAAGEPDLPVVAILVAERWLFATRNQLISTDLEASSGSAAAHARFQGGTEHYVSADSDMKSIRVGCSLWVIADADLSKCSTPALTPSPASTSSVPAGRFA